MAPAPAERSRSLRAAIYARVSFDKTGQARSVEEQEDECRAECARRGWAVVEPVFSDNSFSATRRAHKARPSFEALSRFLATGQADVLVVWAASRAQRTLDEYVDLRRLCADNKVKWSYSGSIYDLTDGTDRFRTGLDALVAEREAENLRDATVRAVERRARYGEVHGPLPDGFKVVYDPNTGKATDHVIDPERAPIVREAVRRILAGESAYAVSKDFNARGIRTKHGKPWTGANLARRIQSPSLAGFRVFRGETIEVTAKWPELITREEHYRVKALYSDPSRRDNREGSRVKHLGSGIYLCGVCNAPLRSLSRARKDKSRQLRYVCHSNFCVQRDAERLDTYVGDVATRFLSRPDVLADLDEIEADDTVADAITEAARLKGQLDDARAKVESGELTLDDLAYFRRKWEPKLREAESRAKPRWLPTAVHDVAGPAAGARWDATPVSGKRAILKALFQIKIHRTSIRGTSFDPKAVEINRREK